MFIADLPSDISLVLPTLGSITGLKYQELHANNADKCYVLSFSVSGGKLGSVETFDLGSLGKEVDIVLRLTRDKVYWLFPSLSRSLPLHVDTQLLLARLKNGTVVAILPLATSNYAGTLRGTPSDGLAVRFERDSKQSGVAKAVVSFAGDIHGAVAEAVLAARQLKSGSEAVHNFGLEGHIFSSGLTYCTWNSLQRPIAPTSTNALAALNHFSDNHVYPRAFLIDDAWQDTENFRLQSFRSMPSFLDGLSDLGGLVTAAKDQYKVKEVGAWHTIQGYWCGVEPERFVDKYKLVKVSKDGYPGPFEPEGFSYYIPHPSDIKRFFDDYYRVLVGHGITFTKCDNMASLDNLVTAQEVISLSPERLGPRVNISDLRIAYKEAVKAAAQTHFGGEGRVIFCMEMTPRVLLGDEIGLNASSSVRNILRNSDDYYPNEPDSHRYHIFTNVVNAMFTSQLNVVPDLDMFQSHPYIRPHAEGEAVQRSDDYPQAAFHAALRALGAGPVTITDVPGKTDLTILNKLVGSTKRGSESITLHASSSPFVSNDIFDPTLPHGGTGKALRVFSKAREGEGGIIGYWNIRSNDGHVQDEVTQADISQLTTKPALLYSQKTQDLRLSAETPLDLPLNLRPFEFDLITVAPILSLANGTKVAALGLLDKYNTLAGLLSFEVLEVQAILEAQVKCSGLLAVWVQSSSAPKLGVLVDGKEAQFEEKAAAQGTLISIPLEPFLEGRETDGPFLVRIILNSWIA